MSQGLLPLPSGWEGLGEVERGKLAAAAGFTTSCCLSIMILCWIVWSPLPYRMRLRKVPPLPCPVQSGEPLPTSQSWPLLAQTTQAAPGPTSFHVLLQVYFLLCGKVEPRYCPQFKTAWPQFHHSPFLQRCLWCYFMLPCWRSCSCWLS